MKELIARGLRAQLEMQSIVTGQLQIALDFYPDKPAVYTGIDKTVQEIPTIPTPLQELTKKLESLPIEEIFNKAEFGPGRDYKACSIPRAQGKRGRTSIPR